MSVITKEQLITQLAESGHIPVPVMRSIYSTFEQCIFTYLSSATPSEDITVKLFDGMSLECRYIPETETTHPETRKRITVPGKIWAKPKITRYYNRKINEAFHSSH